MDMQRALWIFLFYTLVGPFIAALLAAFYAPVAIWANLAPYTAGDHAAFDVANLPDATGLMRLMSDAALMSFVWTPVAAAVTAIGVIAVLAVRGGVRRLFAGISGVIGFFAAYILASFGADDMLPAFAITAGLVSVVIYMLLTRIKVLPPPA